jgi:polysaccharide export outer membrane protein
MKLWSTVGMRAMALLGSGLLLGACTALAQYAGPAVGSGAESAAPAPRVTAPYQGVKIMPGDIISIYTYGAPELSTTAMATVNVPGSPTTSSVPGTKVGTHGEIVLPYLGVVKLAGMTAAEASTYLEKRLREAGILVDPQVTVQLVESPAQTITVIGEVEKPQPVPAYGQLRLLDVISACGGLTPLASHTITIHRLGDPNPITILLGTNPKSTDATNIPLVAGDTVIVSKVGDVFVVGQVKTPQAIPLSSNQPITVLRAISMSGGLNYGAALSKVTIIRTVRHDQQVEIRLDLKKVMHGKEKDVALMSDDILLVPTNGFKAGMASAGNGVASGLTNGLIFRLP